MSETPRDFTPLRHGHVSPFGQAVDRMRVRVQTPGGQVHAGLDGWYDAWVRVAPGYAEQATDAQLETHLGQAARLLFAARTQEYYRLYQLHLGGDPLEIRRNREELQDSFEHRSASASSPDGSVEVFTIGMHTFTVNLAPGTGRRLGSEGLGRVCTDTARQLVDRWLQVVADYKRERWEARA